MQQQERKEDGLHMTNDVILKVISEYLLDKNLLTTEELSRFQKNWQIQKKEV